MAELKTQPTNVDPKAFILNDAPEKHRADALILLDMFAEATQENPVMWGTSIVGYGHYTYINTGKQAAIWPLTGFSPRSANLTLYVMPGFETYDDHLSRLGKHKKSVSCLYINRLSDVDHSVLKDLIHDSYHAMKARYPS